MERKAFPIAFSLWCLGFICVTLDRALVLEISGFKFKLAYFFWLAGLAVLLTAAARLEGVTAAIGRFLQTVKRPPAVFMFLLLIYAFAIAPFSATQKKTLGYTVWLAFDLIAIYAALAYLKGKNAFSWKPFLGFLAFSVIVLGAVILIDDVAYYFFGFRDGLIGFNQDTVLHWGVSRPFAFSYEPSYIALYLAQASAILFADVCLSGVRSRLPKSLGWLALLIGSLALIATTSRSGWAAFGLEVFLGFCFWFWSERRLPKALIAFLALVTTLGLTATLAVPKRAREAVNEKLVHSVVTMTDGSGNARVQSMKIGAEIALATKLKGTGMGASYLFWMKRQDPEKYRNGLPLDEQGTEVVMSTWSEVFAELGIFGLLLYAAFAVSICWKTARSAAESRDPLVIMAFAGAVTFFVFSAHWIPNVNRADVWVWYALWGIA